MRRITDTAGPQQTIMNRQAVWVTNCWLNLANVSIVGKTMINHPPVITINRCYKPFPNGLFIIVLPLLLFIIIYIFIPGMVGIDLYSSQMPWSLHKHSMYIARTQLPTARWIIPWRVQVYLSLPVLIYGYIAIYIYRYIYVWLYIYIYEIIWVFLHHLLFWMALVLDHNFKQLRIKQVVEGPVCFPQVCSGASTAIRSADVCWTIQSSLWWTSSPHGWTAGGARKSQRHLIVMFVVMTCYDIMPYLLCHFSGKRRFSGIIGWLCMLMSCCVQ